MSDPDAAGGGSGYRPPRSGEPLQVLFFGTGVPLHGLKHLLDAVALSPRVRLTLIGGSPEDRQRAADLPPSRLCMREEFVSRAEIDAALARCHLVAGVFGGSEKARSVVPFKVVHGLAAGRPVLTADTPAVRTLLSPGRDCAVCAPGDAGAIARALEDLAADSETLAHLASNARAAYDRAFSAAAVGRRLADVVESLGVPLPSPLQASPRDVETEVVAARPVESSTATAPSSASSADGAGGLG